MQTTETKFITTVDSQRIAYRLDGPEGAPVVLFINSIATTLHMWDGNLSSFTDNYRVLRYDFRGHGESDAPAEPYSIDRFGHDVLEMLDQLGIEQAHVVGLSLGGMVAEWLAVYAPQRVDNLVIVNSAAFLPERKDHDGLIKKALAASDMSEFAAMFIQNWFPESMIQASDSRIEPYRRDLLRMKPQGLAGALAVVRDTDLRHVIPAIEAPTLVIGGEHDTVTQLKFSEEIAASIPHAQLEVLSATHLANIQLPEKFAQLVLDFLHGNSPGKATVPSRHNQPYAL